MLRPRGAGHLPRCVNSRTPPPPPRSPGPQFDRHFRMRRAGAPSPRFIIYIQIDTALPDRSRSRPGGPGYGFQMRVALLRPGAWACGGSVTLTLTLSLIRWVEGYTHHTDPGSDPGDTVRDRDVAGPRAGADRVCWTPTPWPRVAKREFERDGEREREKERERKRETKTLGMHKERRVERSMER